MQELILDRLINNQLHTEVCIRYLVVKHNINVELLQQQIYLMLGEMLFLENTRPNSDCLKRQFWRYIYFSF